MWSVLGLSLLKANDETVLLSFLGRRGDDELDEGLGVAWSDASLLLLQLFDVVWLLLLMMSLFR